MSIADRAEDLPDTAEAGPGSSAWPRALLPHRVIEVLLPLAILASALLLWEAVVRLNDIPPYVLPAPSVVAATLVQDWVTLSGSLLVTLKITMTALALATAGSLALAILFAQSRWIERSFFPFAVVMQVTPIVSIAPLLLIYLDSGTAVLVCAFLVAFFPILSNTTLGLASADHGLVELMDLYQASRWQQLVYLRLPGALPYFLGGLRIGGGLALIGAIVAEIAAGSAGKGSGLAFRIVESGYRLNIPRMFAALALISLTGILIYVAFTVLTHLTLRRWHDSARQRAREMRLQIPDSVERWAIRNARVPLALLDGVEVVAGPDHLCGVDIILAKGRIEALAPSLAILPELPSIDAAGGILLPSPVDAHTHLDKGHIVSRAENPDGTREGALAAVAADREARWSAADVRARMEFALRCAYAHGTAAIRTHLDSLGPQIRISWPVYAELRDAWRDRIDLQASPLFGIDHALDDGHMTDIEDMVGRFGSIVGAVTYPGAALRPGLQRLFRLAAEKGYDLDFHVDETGEPEVNTLAAIAEVALDLKFEGRILAGHCCSLSVMPEAERQRTIDLVARAGIAVVSLPMCNMYLQSRGPATPRWRGTTAYKELHDAGVSVMIASDNTRDPFYAYGDLDMAEVWREGTRILHLDHPFDGWARSIAATPADALGFADRGRLAPGRLADLVLFRARRLTELMARPQEDRIVIRRGRPIETALPSYAELDDVEGLRP